MTVKARYQEPEVVDLYPALIGIMVLIHLSSSVETRAIMQALNTYVVFFNSVQSTDIVTDA